MDGSGENEKRKKKFERKRKRHKLCRKEIDVTEVMDTQLLELRGAGILTKKFYLGGFFSNAFSPVINFLNFVLENSGCFKFSFFFKNY